jgi:hypothetical protein
VADRKKFITNKKPRTIAETKRDDTTDYDLLGIALR